jgi:hypothetical protein
MTTATWDAPTETLAAVKPAKRARVRGLRMPALPSWPLLAQLVGGASTLGGVYLQFGTGVTMIVGGLAATALGMLRESGKI